MLAECRWQSRMIEGALRRGDWMDARRRVVAWEANPAACCSGQTCSAVQGYLHGLSLKLKVMGDGAIADELHSYSTLNAGS